MFIKIKEKLKKIANFLIVLSFERNQGGMLAEISLG